LTINVLTGNGHDDIIENGGNHMVYGAILGDIIGSTHEFDQGPWTKDFELFEPTSTYTDDTIMTLAIARALELVGKDASEDEVKTACTKMMQMYGRAYPYAGYGANFISWIMDRNPQPYNSCGNGSAMRVSPAGWLYEDLDRTREVARWTAEISHNHPEGIKGAECTAAVIWMARHRVTKDAIIAYVVEEFGYDLSPTVEELIPRHRHNETCQDSLPKALIAFYEGDSFEDVIRNAVALGGDTDTIAAIAGSMAEAKYGVPGQLVIDGMGRMPNFLLHLVNQVENYKED
jgi:ADP-ribosylglycohydrolase